MTSIGASAGPPRTGWHDGYVVDVSYIEPINSDLCPAWLSLACVLNGQPPLDTSRPLVWAELGSGSGLSAAMVAAANDGVEVWGCDVNPAHVERSRALVAKAGLTGCTFDEASFEEVARDDRIGPPEVDVVIVHGVYSWISPANQRSVTEFVRRRLRPGGLVYVSYEVPTGWASMVPLAEAMRLHVEADGRRSDLAFPGAVEAIGRLGDGGARSFPLGPNEQFQLANLPTADVRYAVHEYLGAHFQPLMFDQAAEAFAAARCSYVGSLAATDHLSAFWVPQALEGLVRDTTDPVLQGMLRDLVTQRPLRRDLFRKGLAPVTRAEHDAALDGIRLIGLGKELVGGASVDVPVGQVGLDPDYYGPLVEVLAERPLTLSGIGAIHPELGRDDVVASLALLAGGGYGAPEVVGWQDGGAPGRSRRLNEVLVAENALGREHGCLMAPALGSGVGVSYFEMLTQAARWEGVPSEVEPLADHVLASVQRQGRHLLEDGVAVEDQERARLLARATVTDAVARLDGPLAALGV